MINTMHQPVAAAQRRSVLGATLVSALGMLTALGSAPAALAQGADKWPTRAVTMVVPFPPGGVADTVGRPVAEALGRILGQAIVVENRAGAGGGVGMAHVAKAKPDGYTILMALSSITILPSADRVLERKPAYELDQLIPIARFTADPTVLVVRSDSPWQSLDDFLAHARNKPGSITFGSSSSSFMIGCKDVQRVSGSDSRANNSRVFLMKRSRAVCVMVEFAVLIPWSPALTLVIIKI